MSKWFYSNYEIIKELDKVIDLLEKLEKKVKYNEIKGVGFGIEESERIEKAMKLLKSIHNQLYLNKFKR